jgi:hypothetical protein
MSPVPVTLMSYPNKLHAGDLNGVPTSTPDAVTPETLRPCGPETCGGWVCRFHGLDVETQGVIATLRKRLEAAESKLRSEFRCRGLTDAEIAAEFTALAGEGR